MKATTTTLSHLFVCIPVICVDLQCSLISFYPYLTHSSYRPGAGHVSQRLLQPPSVIVLIQLDHFVVRSNLIEDVLGHFAERTGALWKYHDAVLRHHFLEEQIKDRRLKIWELPQQMNSFKQKLNMSSGNNETFTWTYWTQAGLDRRVADDVEFPILKTHKCRLLMYKGK